MKVSVITVCFNSEATIEATINSVIEQVGVDIEYIIIDGSSTDNTLAILNKYSSKIKKVVSEKDNGIYFALNKGISMASGEIIAILHSDDIYASTDVLKKVVQAFKQNNCDGVYGDLQYVKRNDVDKVVRNWVSGIYKPGAFLMGWMPPHPSFFALKKCYDQFGVFNTNFKTSADYELMLRFIHKNKIKLIYLPQVLVKMRSGGQSNVSMANRLKANREDGMAWKVNGLRPGLFTLMLKPLRKIFQFI